MDVDGVVRLRAWSDADLELLRAKNTPEMRAHLGGPETESQILERHQRYLRTENPMTGRMFTILVEDDRKAGTIGYWQRFWRDELVYEVGWGVLPGFQGRGIATAAALAVVRLAHAQDPHRPLHAFPAVDHPASNAVCRKAGFVLLGETDFEYPPGRLMRSNDWRLLNDGGLRGHGS
jgi:RimJ/RimL family protein N-acetyltransferase